jgi:anti-sigma factor RsiW
MSLFGHLEHLRCRRFLDASVDGELTGDRARRVRAHVLTCPRCAEDEEITIVVKRHLGLFRLLHPSSTRAPLDKT